MVGTLFKTEGDIQKVSLISGAVADNPVTMMVPERSDRSRDTDNPAVSRPAQPRRGVGVHCTMESVNYAGNGTAYRIPTRAQTAWPPALEKSRY